MLLGRQSPLMLDLDDVRKSISGIDGGPHLGSSKDSLPVARVDCLFPGGKATLPNKPAHECAATPLEKVIRDDMGLAWFAKPKYNTL
jgi:hypothetical protein